MPRFGWSGAVEGRPGAVARPAGTRSTAPRRPVVRRRRAARSRRCFERGGPPSIFGRRHLAHGEGQLQGSLRLLFSAFAGCASRWMVARPRLSSAVEAVRATPRPSQGLSGTGAAHVPLNGLIWPKDGCASIASAATASGRLSSPGMATPRRRRRGDPDPPIPREARKPPGHHPPLRCGPAAASSIASGLLIAIEAAMGAAR